MERLISVVDKVTHEEVLASGLELTLGSPSVVQLTAKRSEIKNVERQGDQLTVTLESGAVIRINGFFAAEGAPQHDLVLLDDENQLWHVQISEEGFVDQFVAVESVEPLLFNESFDLSTIAWALGGLALVGGAAGVSSGGGSSRVKNEAPQDTTPPAAPVFSVVANADGSVTISGVSDAGDTISVVYPDGTAAAVTAGSDGSYSITSPANQPSGDLVAVATDAAGNASAATIVSYVDATAPQAPVANVITNPDGSLTVAGTSEPGSTVSVTNPDGTTETVTAGADGSYSITTPANQPSGDVVVVAADAAGNVSAQTTISYVDATAPDAPTAEVTVNADGSLTVAGTSESGSSVAVTSPDGSTNTVSADADGSYSTTTSANQPSGDVVVVATDAAGNVSAETTVPYVDATAPDAPTAEVTVNADGSLIVAGASEPGSTVSVTNPDGTTETVTAGADGSYTITSPANQPSGDVVVLATDAAGNISAETTVPYVDATAPDAPTAEVTVNADGSLTIVGTSEPGSTVSVTNPDGTTETVTAGADGSYTITTPANQPSGDVVVVASDAAGNISAETTVPYVDATAPDAPTAEVTVNADGSLTVAGVAEAGSTVSVTNPDGTTETVTAGADGSYTITTPANQPSGDVVIVATDAAGNVSAETTIPYVDATAPDAPTAEVTVNADGSLTIVGTSEPGSTVAVTNPDGTTETVVAGEDGSYTITTPANQPSGDVVVVATDAAGNISAETTIPYVDATAPDAPTAEVTVNADGSLTIVGTSEPGSTVAVTNPDGTTETVVAGEDGSYTITSPANQPSGDVVIVATDAAGNVSAETTVPYVDATAPDAPTAEVTVNADGSLTVSGVAEAGSTVSVTNPDGTTETVTAGADGSYTITTPANQPSGDVVVVATDAAGNISAETTVPYVDATAPDAPTAEVTVHADGSLTVSGVAEAGSTVSVTYPDGTVETVVAGEDGAYTITSPINQPTGDVVAIASDAAGNISAETTIPYVDATAPDAPTAEVTVNADGSLTVAGTSEPGSTVAVTNPDGTIATVTAGADGSYTITSPANQPSGDVVVVATDAAGNVSAETTVPYVDATAPDAPTAEVTVNADGSLTVAGVAEAGSTVSVTNPDGTTETVVAGEDGSYTITTPANQPSGDVVVVATDAAGNISAETTIPYVDATAPDAPTAEVTVNADGSLTVAGVAEAGSTVSVTNPDGTTETVVAGEDGSYTITTPANQPSGDVVVVATDAAGNISAETTIPYVDATAPDAPTAEVTVNADGSLTIVGTSEPGSTVAVTNPDGTTETVVAGADGSYTITTPANQPSGDVVIVATDAAGNVSAETTVPYIDATAPGAPTAEVTVNADGSLTVVGTSEPGSTVSVTNPDGTTETVVAGEDGAYTITTPANQPSGDVVVVATDAAGNISAETTIPYVDATAPDAPTAEVTVNADGSLTVAGVAEAGSTVSVTNPDGTTETVTAGTDGSYTITTPANQPSGDVVVVATDAAGNISAETTIPYVDATAPDAPTAEVTVNADGSLTIVGTSEPGSTVAVTNPDGTTETVVAGEDGSYTITSPANQPSGDVVIVATDAAGNVSAETTVPYVDATAPDAPTAEVTVNADGSLTVAGVAEAGSTVSVTNPDGTTETVVAGEDGSYTITTPANQPSGDVVVVAADAAGNISAETTIPYVDATAPDAPTAEVTVNADGSLTVAGTSEPGSTVSVTNPDGTTETVVAGEDGSYTITTPANQPSGDVVIVATDAAGNVSAETTIPYVDATAPDAPTAEVTVNADGSLTVAGTSEPGSTVSVTNPDGTTETVTAGADGSYSITTPANQPSGDVVVVATDAAGNVSAETTIPYVDATAPDAPTAEVTVNADGSLTIVGTSEPGSTVAVTNPDGTTETVVAGEDGSYTITTPANQPSGDVVVVATDAAGNVSAETTIPYVDATAPDSPTAEVTVNADGSLTVVGTSEPGSTVAVTNPDGTIATVTAGADGSYTITSPANQPSGDVVVVATDAAGNISAETTIPYVDATAPDAPTAEVTVNADGSLTVAGTSEPGSTVSVTNPDGTTETVVAGEDGSYSITTPANQPSGDVVVVATDAAGNISAETTIPYVDATAPDAPTAEVTVNADGSLTVAGVAEAGSTVSVTNPDGTTETVTAGADGSYTITSPINQPTGDVVVIASDAAGNVSAETTVPYVDTIAPTTTATIDSFSDDVGPIQDTALPSGSSTDDSTPTLNGSLTAELLTGEQVNVYRDGTLAGQATVTGTNWTFTDSDLADAPYTYVARVVDASGNLGDVSNSFELTVDTSGPSSSTTQVTIDAITGDDVINAAESSDVVTITGTISGDYSVGDVVTLTTAVGTYTGAVAIGGTWSVEVAAGGFGGNGGQIVQVSILAHDIAGNPGTVTASRPYLVNISAPSGTALSIDSVAGDDIVNASEAAASNTETISGSVTGEFTVGDVVTLTIGSFTTTAAVDANGLWSTTVAGDILAVGTAIDASLLAHNAVGNEATVTASRAYVVDTDLPSNSSTTISFDPITDDNIVNAAEAVTTLTLSGLVSGDYQAGDVITLTINGVQYSGSVAAGGIWTVANVAGSDLAADADRIIDASLVAHDNAGNEGTVSASHNYAVQTDGVTTGLSIDAIAGDNIINNAEALSDVIFSGVSTGTFTEGDVVTLTVNGTAYTTSIDADGIWSVSVAASALGADGAYTATASIVSSDSAGNLGSAQAQRAYSIDTAVPDASSTSLAIDTVAGDDQVNLAESSAAVQHVISGTVSGDFTPSDIVTVTIGSESYSASVTAGSGSTGVWSVSVAGDVLASATTVIASLAASDAAGNVGTILAQHNYVVDITVPNAPTLVVIDDAGSVTGNVADNGGVTDDNTPTYQGTGEAGATINLVINGAAVISVLVDSDGNWSYTAPLAVADGDYTVVVTQADTAGNVSAPVSTTFTVSTGSVELPTLVVSDNLEPVLGLVVDGGSTNDITPTFSGTGVAGATVHVAVNGGTPVDVTVDASGEWSYTPSEPIGTDGSYTVSVTQTTAVGTSGAVTSQFILDTRAPSAEDGYEVAITSYTDDVEPQAGVYLSGSTTNDTSPLLSGTVAGLVDGDEVHIYQGRTQLGVATVSDGNWIYQVTNVSEGTHSYTAVLVDSSGNLGVVSEPFIITVDITAPSAADGYAVAITGYVDDVEAQTGVFLSGTSTNDTSPLLQGSVDGLAPGDQVHIYSGTELLGTASVTADTWTFQISEADEGTHNYTAVLVDAAGNQGLTSEVFTLTVDTIAPSEADGYALEITGYIDDQEEQIGTFGLGTTTNDTSPLLQGTVSGMIAGDTIRIYDGSALIGTASVQGGTWSYAVVDASEGSHTYTAVVVDAAGNEGLSSNAFTLVVDTSAPSAEDGYSVVISSFADDVEAQVGNFPSGSSTNDTSPLLQGSVEGLVTGDFVRIYEGSTLLGTAVVTGENWVFQLADVTEGSHSYVAVLVDAAGNQGLQSDVFSLVVDTRAPNADDGYAIAIIDYVDDVEAQTGTFASGTSTNDTSPVLQGSVFGLVAGDLIRIYDGSSLLGVATVSGDTWSYEVVDASEGTHAYTAVLTDAAGNEGLVSNAFELTVDTQAPSADDGYAVAIVSYTDSVEAQTGIFGNGTSTNDQSPVLNGTVAGLVNGDLVRIYEGTTLLGTAAVSDGTWTFEVVQASEGQHDYTAVLVDAAGNQGLSSEVFSLTVDTTAPSADNGYSVEIVSYIDDVEAQVGSFGSDTSTNDSSPLLQGTVSELASDEFVRIYDGEVLLGTASVNGTAWTYQVADAVQGEHIYTARVVDAAGNEGVLSNAFTLTVDTTAPSAEDGYAIAITAYTDDVEVRTGDFGSGTSTNDPEPLLRGTVSGLVSGDVVRIYEGSTLLGVATVSVDSWTYQLSTITEGLHTYTAVLADAAGNEGLASNAFSLTLDTSVPSEETGYRVAITGYVDDVEAQTGTFVSGTSTNDTSPLLQGTVSGLVDGDDVLIYQGENLLGAATVTGETWAFQVLGLTEGTYTFTAVVADGAGHQGLTSSPLTLTVDRTAPSTEDGYAVAITSYVDNQEAVVGIFGSDTTTNDTSPLLQGSVSGLVTGDEVRIYENGTLLGTAAVFGNSWFYQLAQVSEGAHTYTAILADAAGNEGLNSAAFTLNVDTTAPSADDGYAVAITAFADVVEAQVGDFPNGSSTNDTSPQLKGSVAGLVAGDVVRLYEGANLLGTATVTDGEWLYQLQGVSEGTHTYTAMVVDAAGNEGLRSSEFTLIVDTRAPSVDDGYAVAIIDYVDDVAAQVGSFGSGTATNDTSPVLQGSVAGLTLGDVVRIYESGTLLGVATVSGNNWNYELASVSEGLHTYTAVLADAAGNEGVVSNEFSLIVDTTAPSAEDGYSVAIISYTDDVQAQTGIFGSGTSTNDLSPVLNGTVAGLANGDLVRIYEGTQLLGTATVTAGTWTFEVVQASEGSHTYTAVLADAAGNEGLASDEFTLTVDTRAPSAEDGYAVAITTFTDDVETLVGDYPSGTWTNDNTPLLQGTVEGLQAGDYVRIYQGAILLGNATVTDGTWIYQVPVTVDGNYSYVAVVVDGAGNEGLQSNVFDLIIDTVPPTQTITIDSFTDDFGTTMGNLPSGSTTDDATPVLNGSLSGAIAASDTVSIYEGTTLLGTATVTGTTWSFAIPPSTLIGGTLHTYTAVISDLAGNQGTPSNAFSLTSVVEVNVLVTLDTTPIITGRIPYALVDGARLHVTIDGKTYTSEDGTVMVDSLNSTWYIQIPNENALSVGTHPVLAEIINGDGSNGASGIDTNELIVAPIPVANFGAAGGDGNNKGTTVTMSNTGGWEFFSNQVVFRSTGTDNSSVAEYAGTSLTSNTGGAGYGNNNMNMVQNATFIDINRDGHMDIVGIDSRYSNGQQMFINNGDGTYTARQMADTRATGDGLANTYSWYGGVMAIDFRGDGYVDVIFGDQTPNDAAAMGGYNSQFVQNNAGVFIKDAVYTYTRANGGLNTGNATPDQELSGVDLNNDGTVDVVFHATAGTNKIGAADATGTATSGNTARLVVVKNNGAGGFTTSQIINDAVLYTGDPNIANEPSMTWADYNGDGYMDLFMGRVHGTTVAAQNNSTIFFNDGAGNLASTNTAGVGTATGTYKFNDTVRGGASLAVDWNGDGRMDIIEAPQIGEGTTAVTGTVNLYTNQTSGGTVSFNTSYLQTAGGFGSAAATAQTYRGAISAAGVVTGNPVTGMLSVDVDYDGAKDLLLFTSTGATTYVRNPNVIADGTSMHVRIVDPQGITTYFGNTVKLVNSAGVVVSTQIINPQGGGQTNDSTSIVDFYGLNPNETYSIILLRNINGVTSHVGASSSVAGFTIQHVNSSWGGLKAGEANSAYVLTAQGETESSNTIGAGVVGTGYNDTFFATLGTKRYEGGGGTTEDSDYKTWSNTGGMDIVDFKLAGSTALTIDMSLSGAQNTGWNTVTLSNIEGIAGAAGNDTFTDDAGDNLFEGRGGNDTFNLINGGRDTLLYKVLAGSTADGTGGNGTDTVNGFSLGTWEASPNADRIDLSELLVGYTAGGGARYINGVATIASNETIGQFISVATSNGNTTVSIDRDGNGSAYSSTALVTLNGVSTDLATLLANHQLVVV